MRLLFVCNTLYQIIGACCIRKMFPNDNAELVLSDHSTANERIAKRFQETHLIFDKVYYVKTKFLYGNDDRISEKERFKIFKKKDTVSRMVELADYYDMFFCANAEPFTERVSNYVKKTNPRAKLCWFEDGLSAYSIDRRLFPHGWRRVKNICKRWVYGTYQLTTFIDDFYVFKPELMEWKPAARIKRIEPVSEQLAEELATLFEVEKCEDSYSEKYIFFEDGVQDWGNEADVKLVTRLAEIIGKENILVRIHPRNPKNRFQELGFKTNKNTSIPWEIIATGMDFSNKVLMTMYSQCVITPDILLEKKCKVISLAKLDSGFESNEHDMFDYMNKAFFEKDPEHYIVPQSLEEFENNII